MDDRASADEPPSPIDLTVETRAPVEDVWSTLTEPRRVAEWLTDASPLGRVGDSYRLDFGDGSVIDGVVTELEPGRHFAYTWLWTGAEIHEETHVAWSVDELDDGGTEIRMVHDGWAEAGLDATVRDDHERYWAGYLEDLVAILGEGR